jgi:hypothetical protein
MNYTIISTHDGMALAAFESPSWPDTRSFPQITSYHRTYREPAASADGAVVGLGVGPTCALIVNVAPNSLALIVQPTASGTENWRYFRIDKDYEISPMNSRNRPIPHDVIKSHLLSSSATDIAPPVISDEDLSLLFSVSRPPWLQEILDAQLRHWENHNVGLYYQFTPRQVTREDIWRCVMAAPYWALARWIDRLTPSQLAICMQNSPRGAVAYAIESIPRLSRARQLEKYPGSALLHAADKLTDKEFKFCATREPQAVFALNCRMRLQSDRRAALWSVLYQSLFFGIGYEPPPGLQRDILDSIADYPTVWLAAHHGGGFAAILSGLARRLEIRPDAAALFAMHHRMDPSGRQAFFDHIASLI